MNMMINDLIRKMKALMLQISTMSEVIMNQTRISILQRFCNVLTSAFSEISKLRCFDCDKSDHNVIHCSSINIMCEKKLVHYDINKRLCWRWRWRCRYLLVTEPDLKRENYKTSQRSSKSNNACWNNSNRYESWIKQTDSVSAASYCVCCWQHLWFWWYWWWESLVRELWWDWCVDSADWEQLQMWKKLKSTQQE